LQNFTASDGAQIAYQDIGKGRPLVLLHGLMAHGGFFETQLELADEFRLISVDLRGHGSSKAENGQPTVEQLADDVAGLAGALGLQGAVGIGWSLGAAVLWRVLAGPQRHRFAGSVIVDMSPRVLNDEDWQLGLSREACDARTAAIRGDFSTFAVNAGQAIFAQPIEDGKRETAEWASSEFARNDPASIEAIWKSLVDADFRANLRGIEQPTLVIHGAHSQLYGPGTADHLVRALPDARAVRFDRSGHAPHMEEPQLFNRLIREFAASLPETREVHAIAR
jgi:pimeloyl-ACP methyl ester carboxylesterase